MNKLVWIVVALSLSIMIGVGNVTAQTQEEKTDGVKTARHAQYLIDEFSSIMQSCNDDFNTTFTDCVDLMKEFNSAVSGFFNNNSGKIAELRGY